MSGKKTTGPPLRREMNFQGERENGGGSSGQRYFSGSRPRVSGCVSQLEGLPGIKDTP